LPVEYEGYDGRRYAGAQADKIKRALVRVAKPDAVVDIDQDVCAFHGDLRQAVCVPRIRATEDCDLSCSNSEGIEAGDVKTMYAGAAGALFQDRDR
jgi:hypothetical protein